MMYNRDQVIVWLLTGCNTRKPIIYCIQSLKLIRRTDDKQILIEIIKIQLTVRFLNSSGCNIKIYYNI